MIVLDLEMSGLWPLKHGLWQIGAFELENPKNYFFEEGRIDDEDEVHPSALKVIGKTEEELRDKKKQSQKQLIKRFLEWTKTVEVKNIIGQNPHIDLSFIEIKAVKHGLFIPGEPGANPLPYRLMDLHGIAHAKYYQIKGEYMIKEGRSDMNLSNTLKFCGIDDHRRKLHLGVVIKEGAPHNALEDCKLTAECYSRVMDGKNLFPEFKKFPVPEYLKIKKTKKKG
jgi:DNA polymerase III epsilon subunit-like protein